jgi:tetratricopeptide (TPR) repeat protein
MCRLQRGEFHKAIADFNNFATITPLATAAFYNRAIAYERLGARVEALKDFDRVLLLRPDHQDALAGKARLLRNAVRTAKRPPLSIHGIIRTREGALAAAAIVLMLMGALVVSSLLVIA